MNLQQTFNQVVQKPVEWVEALIAMLPNLAVAVLTVVGFWLLARLARKAVSTAAGRALDNPQVTKLLGNTAYVAMIAAGTFVALGLLGLDKTVTSLLAGVGVIGLALGFAFQDLAANFMAGVLIAFRRPFQLGQIIETNDFMGVVDAVTLRATRVRTFQGQIVYLPNKDVFGNPLVNYSETGKRRIDLGVGVAYGDDLEKARRIAIEAVEPVGGRDKERDVELFYNEFGDSSINFTVRYWIDFEKQTDYLAARSEGIERVKRAFDENGITIPFPIRTLDFGVVGGEKISEALPALAAASSSSSNGGGSRSR